MKYEDSAELVSLATDIVKAAPQEFAQVRLERTLIVFTDSEQDEKGGKCKKVEGAARFKSGHDFIMVITRPEFERLSDFGKVALIVHELHHIGYEGDKTKIHKHNAEEDYCELPEHDYFSDSMAAQIRDKIRVPVFLSKQAEKTLGFDIKDGVRVYRNG